MESEPHIPTIIPTPFGPSPIGEAEYFLPSPVESHSALSSSPSSSTSSSISATQKCSVKTSSPTKETPIYCSPIETHATLSSITVTSSPISSHKFVKPASPLKDKPTHSNLKPLQQKFTYLIILDIEVLLQWVVKLN
jgi:hypothetical protein